jgi:hypothetical protein
VLALDRYLQNRLKELNIRTVFSDRSSIDTPTMRDFGVQYFADQRAIHIEESDDWKLKLLHEVHHALLGDTSLDNYGVDGDYEGEIRACFFDMTVLKALHQWKSLTYWANFTSCSSENLPPYAVCRRWLGDNEIDLDGWFYRFYREAG